MSLIALDAANFVRVPQRLKIIVILVTWFLATGSQWDLVQVFGWGRMFIRHSESMTVFQAVGRTFSGEMCGICKVVNDAKQQERKSQFPSEDIKAKIVLLCVPATQFVFTSPEGISCSPSDVSPLSAGRPAPPTPPPRSRA